MNTGASPGAGIVNQTMQFHGIADRYTLNGASAVSRRCTTNATTATSHPAVTLRSVGVEWWTRRGIRATTSRVRSC